MLEKLEEVPTTFWITAALIYLGSLFQVGYFLTLGTEFLSTISVSDWALSLMLLAGPLMGFSFLIIWAAQLLGRGIERFFGSHIITRISEVFPSWLIMTIFLYLALYTSANVRGFSFWYDIFYLAFMLGYTAWIISIEDKWWRPDAGTWLLLVIGWGMCTVMVGKTYGLVAGRVCTIAFKEDGRQLTAVYMRTVSAGHLVRLRGSTYLYPSSELNEIKCAWEGNTLDARIKLLK